jgi:hypothetical protein
MDNDYLPFLFNEAAYTNGSFVPLTGTHPNELA